MRRSLWLALFLASVVAATAVSSMFLNSMEISEEAKSRRAVFDLSGLNDGEFKLLDYPRNPSLKVLIIKDWNGVLYSYFLPSKNGKITMPDTSHGWWGYYNCADFSPEMESAKKIKKSGRIVCHDIEAGGWNRADWVWTYDGKPLNPKGHVPPMWPVNTERVGNDLYLNAG